MHRSPRFGFLVLMLFVASLMQSCKPTVSAPDQSPPVSATQPHAAPQKEKKEYAVVPYALITTSLRNRVCGTSQSLKPATKTSSLMLLRKEFPPPMTSAEETSSSVRTDGFICPAESIRDIHIIEKGRGAVVDPEHQTINAIGCLRWNAGPGVKLVAINFFDTADIAREAGKLRTEAVANPYPIGTICTDSTQPCAVAVHLPDGTYRYQVVVDTSRVGRVTVDPDIVVTCGSSCKDIGEYSVQVLTASTSTP